MFKTEASALHARINDKTRLDAESGCRVWEGATHSNGVPRIRVEGTLHDARRVLFYAITGRALPTAAALRPGCGNRICVDPRHLIVSGDIGTLDALRKSN